MKEAQQVVAEKTSALEAEAYKTKRLQVSKLIANTFLKEESSNYISELR